MNYRDTIEVDGKRVDTLKDILPDEGFLTILFVGKTPAHKSVEIGHYFQGQQGKCFWNKLKEYNLLDCSSGLYEDENLLNNNYGITDIVKIPHKFKEEPTGLEYRDGCKCFFEKVNRYNPKIIVFVYKRTLDEILKYQFNNKEKTNYGFNVQLNNKFNSEVFVFPMPGVGGLPKQKINDIMESLKCCVFKLNMNLVSYRRIEGNEKYVELVKTVISQYLNINKVIKYSDYKGWKIKYRDVSNFDGILNKSFNILNVSIFSNFDSDEQMKDEISAHCRMMLNKLDFFLSHFPELISDKSFHGKLLNLEANCFLRL